MPEFFDIHSHFNIPGFPTDIAGVVSRMKENRVWTVAIGVNKETCEKEFETAGKNDGVFFSCGVHPDDVEEGFDEKFFKKFIASPKTVAVGECGLDYVKLKVQSAKLKVEEKEIKNKQKEVFERQINFAVDNEKPMMIHCRSSSRKNFDAYEDTLEILKSYQQKYGDKVRGDMHFFAADVETAKKFLELGFSLSFTGVITFASDYDEVIKYAPLDRIMSETDSPFVAPVPYRGKPCEPSYVKEVVKRIAEIRNEPFEKVKMAMVKNALSFFKLKVQN